MRKILRFIFLVVPEWFFIVGIFSALIFLAALILFRDWITFENDPAARAELERAEWKRIK